MPLFSLILESFVQAKCKSLENRAPLVKVWDLESF